MAQSIYECKQIIELLNKFKIKFGINHQMRKMPNTQRLESLST